MTVGIPGLRVECDDAAQVVLGFLIPAQRNEHLTEGVMGLEVIRALLYRDAGGIESLLIPALIIQGLA